MPKPRYHDFAEDIDIDALEAAIGFEPFTHDRGNDIGYCLWPENHTHGDTTGKFAIHRDKGVYNCFVCGGGDLLSLAMELYDFDVDEATDWLLQFAQHDMRTDAEFTDYLLKMLGDVEERTSRMPYFNQRVLDRFKDDRSYFLTRGITQEVINEYHLCYGNSVMKPAPFKQRGEERVKEDEDYFGPAAIFPHYWQGRLVGWQHRWMDWDEEHSKTPRWLSKYTNTTDFPKATTLFNYDHALKARKPVVVLESSPSVLFLRSFEIPAVGFFGEVPKDAQLRLMRRFTSGVILAPDNDKAGNRLLSTATNYLERFIPVYHAEVVDLGEKADLGDYAKTDEPYENLRNHLRYKVHKVGVEL